MATWWRLAGGTPVDPPDLGSCEWIGGGWPVRAFDGAVLTVRIPMTFRRRGGRKLILAPDGAADLAAEPPRPNGTALRALGRAWRWHRLLEAGHYGSIKALARAEGVHHAYVAKLLRLTLLAPHVVEAVLDGRLPKGVRLEDLVRPLPANWEEQRDLLLALAARGVRPATS